LLLAEGSLATMLLLGYDCAQQSIGLAEETSCKRRRRRNTLGNAQAHGLSTLIISGEWPRKAHRRGMPLAMLHCQLAISQVSGQRGDRLSWFSSIGRPFFCWT